jgi:formate dehydrogenase assembly factor FdhD
MRRLEIKKGAQFGDLTIVGEIDGARRMFRCKCVCGAKTDVRLDHLRSGHTSSCGGCGIEYAGKRMTLKKWAEKYQIKESTLRARLKRMSMKEAIALGKKR